MSLVLHVPDSNRWWRVVSSKRMTLSLLLWIVSSNRWMSSEYLFITYDAEATWRNVQMVHKVCPLTFCHWCNTHCL